MNVPRFRGRGSTAVRRAFWNQLSDFFATQQKLGGHNVVVDEFPGEGTQINIAALTGACCHWYGCAEETFVQCMSDANFPVWMGAGTRCADVDCPSYACCYCDADPDCFNAADPAMCEYYGFASAGLDTTCDDCATSESVPPCGCCCFDGDCSYPWTQSDCEGSVGEFTEGLCCSSTVHCDSSQATKTKCGFTDFNWLAWEHGLRSQPDAIHIYRQLVNHVTEPGGLNPLTCDDCSPPCFFDASTTCTVNDSCDIASVDSGEFCCGGGTGGCTNDPFPFAYNSYTYDQDSFVATQTQNAPCQANATVNITSELSDEYTTEQLIENALAALPDYRGCFDCLLPCDEVEEGDPCCDPAPIDGQSCDCSAYFHLTDDELTCSVQAFKYYIEVLVQSFDQLVTWVERFTPDDGSDPIDTDQSEVVAAGDTQTSVYTVDVPTDFGETTVEDVVCKAA